MTLPSPWVNGKTAPTAAWAATPPAVTPTPSPTLSADPIRRERRPGRLLDHRFVGFDPERLLQLFDRHDLFFNGQPVPQTPTATLSTAKAQPGDSVTVTGGTNWWGSTGGAPNSGPYGDDQAGCPCTGGRPERLHWHQRARRCPVLNSTVTIGANPTRAPAPRATRSDPIRAT